MSQSLFSNTVEMCEMTHWIIYSYVALDTWFRTTQITILETCSCHFMSCSLWLAARDLLYALSLRLDSTCHGRLLPSCEALAGTRNWLMEPPSWWPIASQQTLPMSSVLLPKGHLVSISTPTPHHHHHHPPPPPPHPFTHTDTNPKNLQWLRNFSTV